MIKIRSTVKTDVEVIMYNLSGKEVLKQTIFEGTNELYSESIPQGIYFVELRNGENYFVRKVIKN